jgi:hypothetical protein
MAQRRHIRVSRSLEGGGERPARRYGAAPSRGATDAANVQRLDIGSPQPAEAGQGQVGTMPSLPVKTAMTG